MDMAPNLELYYPRNITDPCSWLTVPCHSVLTMTFVISGSRTFDGRYREQREVVALSVCEARPPRSLCFSGALRVLLGRPAVQVRRQGSRPALHARGGRLQQPVSSKSSAPADATCFWGEGTGRGSLSTLTRGPAPEGVSSALVCLDPARQATGFRAHRSERWRSLRCGVDSADSCHSAGQLGGRWARRPGERWEARRASPLSPGPGAWDWSRSRGLLALCPGLTLGEILCEPARKRATAPGACRGAWGRGSRLASGTGARGGGSVTSPAGFAPSRLWRRCSSFCSRGLIFSALLKKLLLLPGRRRER